MSRIAVTFSIVVACALGGVLAAALVPVSAPAAAKQTTTTPPVIADGVTIGGIPVGGLTPDLAAAKVLEAFEVPLVVYVADHVLEVSPARVGAVAQVQRAVERARNAPAGAAIPLLVTVNRDRVRAYVATIAKRFDRKPVDSRLLLRRLRPFITEERAGRALARQVAAREITASFVDNSRAAVRLGFRALRPKVTRKSFGPVIVIRRGSNRLYLYRGIRFWRVFGVATGQKTYPTPLGRFRIVVKWRNPWWYPPKSPWAKGQKPIPPGPANPLGTRWMGISSPGVGIHGTPQPGSIGYSVSHGCVRMRIPDAEWLFERVRIGTTVFIVAA